jgi:hypothetical protein
MPRGRVGGKIGNRTTSQPNRSNADGVWGLQEAYDALWRSSWPTVLAPPSTSFSIWQNPSDVDAACNSLNITFTSGAYRNAAWNDPIALEWQKATRNADTPITGNIWIADSPSDGWWDDSYASGASPAPLIQEIIQPLSVPSGPGGDPLFADVPLMLSMENQFTNSSLADVTFTAVGGATTSTTQKKYGNASGFFDGSNDYLMSSDRSLFYFGSASFTLEAWIYLTADANACIISEEYTGQYISFALGVSAQNDDNNIGRYLFFGCYNYGWWERIYAQTPLPLNQWVHVAAIRDENRFLLYANGELQAFGQKNNNMPPLNNRVYVGRRWDLYGSQPYFPGYIDDLRVTRNTARYKLNFTVPVDPFPTSVIQDPDYANVSLMLPMNSTTGFTDYSNTPKTMNVLGNTVIGTTVGHGNISGSAGQFDGTDDYLDTPSGTPFAFSSNFTVEGWFYFTNNTKGYQGLIGTNTGYDASGWLLSVETNNRIYFYGTPSWGGGWWYFAMDTGVTPPLNTWVHIAVCRLGYDIFFFFNGQLIKAQYYDYDFSGGNTLEIGGYSYFPSGMAGFEGYMHQIRITKNVCRYTGDFTPPATALPTFRESDPYAADVKLLLNFETGLKDRGPNNLRGSLSSGASITSAARRFGSYSLTNGNIVIDGDLSLSGSFTLEGWFYFSNVTTKRYLYSSGTLGYGLFDIYVENGRIYFQYNGATIQPLPGTGANVVTGLWQHIAFVRNTTVSPSAIACFVNGAYQGDFLHTGILGDTALEKCTYVYVAANDYVDEVRLTAAARYSTASPPNVTSAFFESDTKYYLSVSGGGSDVNGLYYPAIFSDQTYNRRQCFKRADNKYCLIWTTSNYWLIHQANTNGDPSGEWQYYSESYNWQTIESYPEKYNQPQTSTLTLPTVTFLDNETFYRLKATSGFQTIYSNPARLRMEALNITFIQQPTNQVVNSSVSSSATFSIQASAAGRISGTSYNGSLTYQWQKKGQASIIWNNINGATGTSINVNNLTITDSGEQFRCRVGCGAINVNFSNPATLTVT